MSEHFLQDTIAAISTPKGRGAIGIIRLSGPLSMDILNSVFVPKRNISEYPFSKFVRGAIYDGSEAIDDVLIVCMPQKKSYTGDLLIEIHAHGNPFILSEVLGLLVKRGARLAQPGEFTFRAYMNGKMDLAQAEAVIDLIQSRNRLALNIANRYLKGEYSEVIEDIRSKILDILSHVEASIDFSTEEIELFSPSEISGRLALIEQQIRGLLATYQHGRLISEGVRAAIIGRPNTGKSSLLNALLKQNRAIVAEEAGTTRDTIEEQFTYEGVTLQFIDTAGIRKTDEKIEKLGIQKSYEKIKTADLLLLVLDVSRPIQPEDRKLLDQLVSREHILVMNKIDLEKKLDILSIRAEYPVMDIQNVSALNGEGVENLMKAIHQKVLGENFNSGTIFLTKLRHKEALERSLTFLENVKQGISNNLSFEFLALDLKASVESLEQIIGRIHMEEIYDKIFISFCIGK